MSTKKNEFRDWMDHHGVSNAEAADALDISVQTLAHWRSQGVPARRLPHVAFWIKRWEAKGADGTRNRVITVDADADQFRSWNKASMLEGKLLEDWARDGLDELAEEAVASGELKEVPKDESVGEKNSGACPA